MSANSEQSPTTAAVMARRIHLVRECCVCPGSELNELGGRAELRPVAALDPAGLARHAGEVERHPSLAERRQVLGNVAGAEPVRRRRRRVADEMDRVPCEEYAHFVALVGGGAGDE